MFDYIPVWARNIDTQLAIYKVWVLLRKIKNNYYCKALFMNDLIYLSLVRYLNYPEQLIYELGTAIRHAPKPQMIEKVCIFYN